ncbi:MAG: CoA transferase [bacterium]|nr:CoA transferase [bacterium]
MAGQPLSGLLVADFSRVLAAPIVSMNLADLGANVVKVERPHNGDDTRSWGPPWTESGDSTYYLGLNRGKRSIALDLKNPLDLELARKLAVRADVVIENFRSGLMDQFGLGYGRLSSSNPGLIYCSISGFAPEGPTAKLAGYDLLIQAMSGIMSVTGQPDNPPTKVGAAITDMTAGLYATIGVLAALQQRAVTGRGQRVDVSLFDSALNSLLNQGSAFINAGVVGSAQGNRHPSIAPYQSFQASDRAFVLAAANDRMWLRTCTAIDREDLSGDPRFSSNSDRRNNIDTLESELQRTFDTKPADHWIAALRTEGVPAGPINNIDAAFAWATDNDLDPIVGFAGSDARGVRSPIRLSDSEVGSKLPPPDLDEHGATIRAWLEDL